VSPRRSDQSVTLRQALVESTIGLFKTELIEPRRPWKTLSEVEPATAEWTD
jgi:putative transposase